MNSYDPKPFKFFSDDESFTVIKHDRNDTFISYYNDEDKVIRTMSKHEFVRGIKLGEFRVKESNNEV